MALLRCWYHMPVRGTGIPALKRRLVDGSSSYSDGRRAESRFRYMEPIQARLHCGAVSRTSVHITVAPKRWLRAMFGSLSKPAIENQRWWNGRKVLHNNKVTPRSRRSLLAIALLCRKKNFYYTGRVEVSAILVHRSTIIHWAGRATCRCKID